MAENPYQANFSERLRRMRQNTPASPGVTSPLGSYSEKDIYMPVQSNVAYNALSWVKNAINNQFNKPANPITANYPVQKPSVAGARTVLPTPLPINEPIPRTIISQPPMPPVAKPSPYNTPTIAPSALQAAQADSMSPTPKPQWVHREVLGPGGKMIQVPMDWEPGKDMGYNPTFNPPHPQAYYANRLGKIQPQLYDAIVKATKNDLERRYMFALALQESGGGYNPHGDEGNAYGPFHINVAQRKSIKPEQAMDPTWAVNYLLAEMRRNMDAGVSPVYSWNRNSGYVNGGPRYDQDLPVMATTSSFIRGK